ncbi:MAG: AzlD domain-containing protein [Solirubrobacteraceae bacterium]
MTHGIWILIAAVAVGTAVLKASGPVSLAGRQISARTRRVISLLPASVLAGLVVSETFTTTQPHQFAIDARAAGLLAAGVALLLRAPLVLVLIIAAAVTALLRAA